MCSVVAGFHSRHILAALRSVLHFCNFFLSCGMRPAKPCKPALMRQSTKYPATFKRMTCHSTRSGFQTMQLESAQLCLVKSGLALRESKQPCQSC